LINAHIRIKFNTSVKSIDDGVKHLQAVLSTGSSREICIQPKFTSGLCPLHSELDVKILERDDKQLCAKIIIKYPICMCGRDSGISIFLGSLLYYTVFSFVAEYHILDFDITNEEDVLGLFPGPKHGVKGIRDLLNEQNEPLIGVILKPRTRIDLTAQKRVIEELARSGKINYIIDDELVVSPKCCRYEDKIDCYSDLIHRIASDYHYKMLYWVNVSCDLSVSQKVIEYSLAKGVNTFSLNAVTMGFTSVKYIIEKYSKNAFFLVNNIGRGILTRPSGFFMSECVLSKMSRLIGADAVYTGPLTKEFPYDADILEVERRSLQDVWWSYKKSFSVSSGNIDTSKNAIENIQALGKDTMIQMGSGLLGTEDVLSKLTTFKFLISNALNPNVIRFLRDAVESEETTKSTIISKGETSMGKRDFFISYNSNDRLWATWIAEVLEQNSYSVYLQEWDIRPGDDFIEKMHEILKNSSRFMPIISTTYIDAPYCKAEWSPALATAISNKGESSFVPVRIADVSPDGILKTRVYIDLFNLEEDMAKKQLLDGLKPISRKHIGVFPGTTTKSKTSPITNLPASLTPTVVTVSTEMTNSESKRVELLKKSLSEQINNRIRLLNTLAKTRDPIYEGQYENDLEKCEGAILEFALQLAELSTKYQQIEADTYLTSDLFEICKRNANKVSETDSLEVKSDLFDVSKEIIQEVASKGIPHQDIEQLTADLSAKGTLELTIPIIPFLLNYKAILSLETKSNFKKMIVSLFRKIKGVLT